jgi:CheY-like chemotaxis protein
LRYCRHAPHRPAAAGLHLEDSELDHELAMAHLRRNGLAVDTVRVDTRVDFEAALDQPWDAIVSDFNLPGFSGLQALDIVRARDRIVPFILVSGEIGEDTAVAAMRSGASDYLLKNQPGPAGPGAGARHRGRPHHAPRPRPTVSWPRRASACPNWPSTCRPGRSRTGRHRPRDPRRRRRLADGAEVRPRLDPPPQQRPQVQQRAVSALETVSHAIGASQRIMHNLRPAILEQGLVAALQWLASRFEKRTGIGASSAPAMTQAALLPPGVPLVAYRTAQEALTNVSKHAQATRVTIDLSLSGGVLSLEVSDNGRGLSRDDLAKAAASACAACTSGPPRSAAGST